MTAAEIPDGDRLHCTGVSSTIHHNPNPNEPAYGLVWFHSEQSFLEEIIRPYYEKLRWGTPPTTLQDFAQQPLPSLPSDLKIYAAPKAMHEHLTDYRDKLGKYYHLLTTPSPLRISREQIREYVAQDNTEGHRIYFNYMAVKKVEIFCPFPNSDIGSIALIDTLGLGDTGVGDEERLVKTLGEDVDAILFVRMPKSSGDYWADVDVQLYDTAKKALVDLPVNLWSFLVLNQTALDSNNGDNSKNCLDLADSLNKTHIEVVKCAIADCANSQPANQVLDEVLNYLTANITALDKQYASACQERLNQLYHQINVELNKARNALVAITSDTRKFLNLFEQLLQDIASGLVELVAQLQQQRQNIDPYFEQQVKSALKACEDTKCLPSETIIKSRAISPEFKQSYEAVYRIYIAELRACLSQHFLSLDEGMKQSIYHLKSQVTDVLVSQGRLGEITQKRGPEFLKLMADLLSKQQNQLELGFTTLWKFDISYGALLLKVIRESLNKLLAPDTNKPTKPPLDAAAVRANLELLHKEAIAECSEILERWLTMPSQVGYYMVEEFVDRILYAEGIKEEWFVFLNQEDVRSLIWPEFKQLDAMKQLQQGWNGMVERAISANQLDALQFLT